MAGSLWWPFVIFISIIINVEIILTLTHVSFLGYLYHSCGERKESASKLVRH